MNSQNIFESFRFCYFLNKFSGNLFFTIEKDSRGNFYSSTSAWDFFIFFCSASFAFYNFLKVSESSQIISNSSVIVELAVRFNDKIVYFKFFLTILWSFVFRHNIYEILANLNWIDLKVNFSSIKKTT